MNILAIGAHADDVELGCGGALLKWAAAGHSVTVYTATESAYAAPDGTPIRTAEVARVEAESAAAKLGARLILGDFKVFDLAFAEPLNVALLRVLDAVRPDVVLTHWEADTHPDHQALGRATLHACRRVRSVLTYASNWYMGTAALDPRCFVDITGHLDAKLNLIATYESEYGRTGGAWEGFVRDRAAQFGRVLGCQHAEAFGTVRVELP